MNRQTKRLMQRQGGDQVRAPERRPQPVQRAEREKVTPKQYLGEVKGELRKVAWPTRREVSTSTIVVLICVVVMTSLIFLYDYASSNFVLFLFD